MFFYGMSENSSSHVAPAILGSVASFLGAGWGMVKSSVVPAQANVSTFADNIPIIGGLAIGIMGIGWSIYSAGPNKLVITLGDEIKELRSQVADKNATIKNQDQAIAASLSERNKLLADIGRLEGLLAKLQAQAVNTNSVQPPVSVAHGPA